MELTDRELTVLIRSLDYMTKSQSLLPSKCIDTAEFWERSYLNMKLHNELAARKRTRGIM